MTQNPAVPAITGQNISAQDTVPQPPEPGAPPGRRFRTAAFVGTQVSRLQEQYVRAPQPTAYSRAALAQLRRGVGKPIGALPELLELVIDPEASRPHGDDPTADEVAAYTAITLYAIHQQSRDRRMHDQGYTFGSAVGSLRFTAGEENEGVIRRFQALGTASGIDELVQHARGLVTLLRAKGRGFDYGRFAQDLLDYQNPRRADNVRLAWGRDFYRVTSPVRATIEEQP